MKIKTNELTGAALDWAVAKAAGIVEDGEFDTTRSIRFILDGYYTPSTNWAQAGPLIETAGITVVCWAKPGQWEAQSTARLWMQINGPTSVMFKGPTALIAAMRCYVASKLGDEIDLPEELT